MDTIVTTMGLTGVVPGLTDMDMDTGSVFYAPPPVIYAPPPPPGIGIFFPPIFIHP